MIDYPFDDETQIMLSPAVLDNTDTHQKLSLAELDIAEKVLNEVSNHDHDDLDDLTESNRLLSELMIMLTRNNIMLTQNYNI